MNDMQQLSDEDLLANLLNRYAPTDDCAVIELIYRFRALRREKDQDALTLACVRDNLFRANVMCRVGGKTWHCPDCGCNVQTKLPNNRYRCNGCDSLWIGTPLQEIDAPDSSPEWLVDMRALDETRRRTMLGWLDEHTSAVQDRQHRISTYECGLIRDCVKWTLAHEAKREPDRKEGDARDESVGSAHSERHVTKPTSATAKAEVGKETERCQVCRGTGDANWEDQQAVWERCPECHGSGSVQKPGQEMHADRRCGMCLWFDQTITLHGSDERRQKCTTTGLWVTEDSRAAQCCSEFSPEPKYEDDREGTP